MGNSNILLGRKPAMDQHLLQGGVAILLSTPHAKETKIHVSSGCLGLWLGVHLGDVTLQSTTVYKQLEIHREYLL